MNDLGDWAIIGASLLAGYWAVSLLMQNFQKGSESKQNGPSKSEGEKGNNNASSSRPWYDVLEISPSASIDEIKVSYRKSIRMYHPDRVETLGPEFRELAERRAKEINQACRRALREL